MEFDKSKVYTTLNADELKVGSKVICANSLLSLKCKVHEGHEITKVKEIVEESNERRFRTEFSGLWPLVYLVSEPEETWIVYLCRSKNHKPYLTSCRSDRWEIVQRDYGAKTKLFEGTKDECIEWYKVRRKFTDEIAAWEDGKTIQGFMLNTEMWEDLTQPLFDPELNYRIKPEGLKWTDLKIGDIIQNKSNTHCYMVIGIDVREESKTHIYNGVTWLDNDDLNYWER